MLAPQGSNTILHRQAVSLCKLCCIWGVVALTCPCPQHVKSSSCQVEHKYLYCRLAAGTWGKLLDSISCWKLRVWANLHYLIIMHAQQHKLNTIDRHGPGGFLGPLWQWRPMQFGSDTHPAVVVVRRPCSRLGAGRQQMALETRHIAIATSWPRTPFKSQSTGCRQLAT